MARGPSRGSGATASSRQDNFTHISGIGPTINAQLHHAGIQTFDQLGASSPDKIAAVVASRSASRIAKEHWIGRPQCSPQHYETFTIELLLSADNDVRRTHVTHVQSGVEDNWANWDSARLTYFLVQHGGLHSPSIELALPVSASVLPTAPEVAHNFRGTLQLRETKIIPVDADSPPGSVRDGQPFDVQLAVDLTDVVMGSDTLFAYTAILCARKPGSSKRQILCEAHGPLVNFHMINVRVERTTQMQGIYRLEAIVTLVPQLTEPETRPGLITMKEIGLLQIY
jgi:hypothetical protein